MKKSPSIIHINNLTRRFGELTAVDDLSLEVYTGEIFGFLGHNGAGKTTTIRLLNGILEPHGGGSRVLDLDPISDGPQLRSRTGVLTESASLDTRLTARENLLIYADLFGVPRDRCRERVEELLSFFGLTEFAESRVEEFSTGMRQRLSLARTLLHDPEILFLDEPTSGLDPVAAHQVNTLISNLARDLGRTVFLCTHNLIEAQKLCDRVGVMEHGRLVALGTPSELVSQYVRRLDVDIEIDPEQLDAALELLSGHSELIPDQPVRNTDHLTVPVIGRDSIPDLLAILVHQGIQVYSISPHQPTLEDVYFAIHGEKEVQK
jgi:ABC-2 type transport system ATP-binding protein